MKKLLLVLLLSVITISSNINGAATPENHWVAVLFNDGATQNYQVAKGTTFGQLKKLIADQLGKNIADIQFEGDHRDDAIATRDDYEDVPFYNVDESLIQLEAKPSSNIDMEALNADLLKLENEANKLRIEHEEEAAKWHEEENN